MKRNNQSVVQKPDQPELITRYLLGELAEPEQQRFEESYLADGAIFDELLRVEAEVIEGYLQNMLTPDQRERFERHFLRSDERRARVASLQEQCRPDSAALIISNQAQTQLPSGHWWRKWLTRLRIHR
jgi:anti-sigma factor RsiW